MSNDVNVHLNLDGARQFQGDWRTATTYVDEFGNTVEDTSRKVDTASRSHKDYSDTVDKSTASSRALSHVTGELKSMLVGMVGVGAAVQVLRNYLDHLKQVNEATKALAETTRGLEQATKSYAGQAGVMGDPKQVAAARDQIRQLQRAAHITDWSTAEGVMVSTHSAIGTTGQLLSPAQLGVAFSVGEFAQRKQLDQAGVDSMLKLIAFVASREGRELNDQTAIDIMNRLSTVQLSSKAASFGEFAPGAIASIMKGMSYGLPFQEATAQFAAAMEVEKNPVVAAERTKQAYESLLNDKVVEALAARSGISASHFRRLPFDQRLAALNAWVSSTSDAALAEAGVPPEKISSLSLLFTPEQIPQQRKFRSIFAGANVADFQREATGWWLSGPGRTEAQRAQTLAQGAAATDPMMLGAELFATGEEIFRQRQATGQAKWWLPNYWERTIFGVYEPLQKRLQALRDRRDELPPEMRSELGELSTEVHAIFPSSFLAPSMEDVGNVSMRLERLERRLSGPTTVIHNQTNYMPRTEPLATTTHPEDQR